MHGLLSASTEPASDCAHDHGDRDAAERGRELVENEEMPAVAPREPDQQRTQIFVQERGIRIAPLRERIGIDIAPGQGQRADPPMRLDVEG